MIRHTLSQLGAVFAEYFEQIDAIRDLFDAIGWEHVELDPAEIEGSEIDLDEHRKRSKPGSMRRS